MVKHPQKRQTIVLTGGIASGKTSVSDYLASKGANIIDTDIIARELTDPESELSAEPLGEIRKQFGDAYFLPNGAMDRKKVRNLVFNDPQAKKSLENILHQRIFQQVLQQLRDENHQPYDVVVVPLLHAQSPYLALADRVLVVEVPYELQLQRLMSRDKIDRNLADKIIQSQISRLERRQLGDDILINERQSFIEKQLDKLHQLYSDKLSVVLDD